MPGAGIFLINLIFLKCSLRFLPSWYQLLRVSSNHVISKIFNLVPEVKSAEKLLHEHEVETTTSFVMYFMVLVKVSLKSEAPQMNSGTRKNV